MTSRRLREWPQGLQNPPESTPMTWAIIKKRHTYAHTLHLITQLTTLSLSHYSDLEIQVVLCQIFVLKRLVNRKISFVSQSGTRRTPSWKRDEIRCPLSKPLSTRLRCGQKTWSVELCSLVATGKRRWTSDWSNLHSSTIPSANFRSILGPWSGPHPATTGLPSHTLKPLYPWSPFTGYLVRTYPRPNAPWSKRTWLGQNVPGCTSKRTRPNIAYRIACLFIAKSSWILS